MGLVVSGRTRTGGVKGLAVMGPGKWGPRLCSSSHCTISIKSGGLSDLSWAWKNAVVVCVGAELEMCQPIYGLLWFPKHLLVKLFF